MHPYLVEGIGEDFWPTTFDPSLVDEYVTVSDRDSFLTARRLAREEGILVGGSGGTAVWAMLEVAKRYGPDATIVTLIPDSGRGYLSKLYDDNWLAEYGILERRSPSPRIDEVLAFKRGEADGVPELIFVESHEKVGHAIELMQRYGISQIPVVRHEPVESLADVVGSVRERGLLERLFANGDALNEDVAAAMEPPLPAVELERDRRDDVHEQLAGGRRRRRGGEARRRPHPRRPARVPGPRAALASALSLTAARRLAVAAQGYAGRRRRGTADDVAAAVRRASCIQLDSITAVERSHRIVLGARVGTYPRGTVSAAPVRPAGSSSTGATRRA